MFVCFFSFIQKFKDSTTCCKIEFTGTPTFIPPHNNGNGGVFYTYIFCGISRG